MRGTMLVGSVLTLSALAAAESAGGASEANILDIGGIFPITGKGGWQGGQVRIGLPFVLRVVLAHEDEK